MTTTTIDDTASDARPPYLWALVTFLVIMVVYAITLSPTTAFWDTSEYIAAAKVLGIPHPPGNPLFTVLAHVWGYLPIAANYAKRINYFAAVTSAGGAAFWFLVAERWTRRIVPARGVRLAACFAGIFASAMAWTVWNQSTVNEKVYTVSLLSIALIVWCMVRWADLPDSPRRNGLLIFACYVGALTSTNHMMGVLGIPVIAIYVLWTEPKLLREPWIWLMAWTLAVGVAGILGDALTALVHGGNLGNPDIALTFSGAVDGASGFSALVRIAALLGIVGFFAWGLAKDPRNPLLYVGFIAVVVGLTLNYVYLPIRAAQFPPINEGEPVGFFSQALSDVLNRVQYGKPPLLPRQPWYPGQPPDNGHNLAMQLGMYWDYWKWQWAKDWNTLVGPITGVFTALCAWGLGLMVARDRRAGITAGVVTFVLTVLLIYYLNFKFRYGTPGVDCNSMCEVRERDYFFVASFAFSGVLLAAGFGAAIRSIAEWVGDRLDETRRWIVGTPVLALAVIPLLGNRESAPRNNETLASDFAVDMLNSVDPYGILITAGDNDTFPLWFAQEVLGVRRDVTLANLSLMNTNWHLEQLRRRVTPPFDAAAAPGIWRPGADTNAVPLTGSSARDWVQPQGPALTESTATLDSLPDVSPAPKDSLQLGTVWVHFTGPQLTKSDIATLLLIRDNVGKRPIFFSWSDGGYPDGQAGSPIDVHRYLVTQGMVRKLMPEPVAAGGPIVDGGPYLGMINVPLTRALLFGVYHPESAAKHRARGWFDPPSASILILYDTVYQFFQPILLQAGDSTDAARAGQIVARIDAAIGVTQ